MSDMHVRSTRPPQVVQFHRDGAGIDRGYLRYAVIGDAAGRRHRDAWAWRLADDLARRNIVSMCDRTSPGATAYDTRRVQLREAIAHRPHLVALVPGLAGIDGRDWDGDAVRGHLLHCAMVATQHAAIVMTVRLDPQRSAVDRLWPARRRRQARIEFVNAVFAEIDRRYGGIHLLAPATRSGRSLGATVDRFSAALSSYGIA